jgi:hypothetical protein
MAADRECRQAAVVRVERASTARDGVLASSKARDPEWHMSARASAVLGVISNFVTIVLIGVSIGWLSGLSSSSLFSFVLPVLLTMIASAFAAFRMPSKPVADAAPAISIHMVAVLAIGLAAGASLGTTARLGDWLAPDPERIIARWNRWSAIIPHDDVVRRVYERALTDPYRVNRPAPPPPTDARDIVREDDAACRAIVAQADSLGLEELKAALRARDVAWAAVIAPIDDVKTLRAVAKNLCNGDVRLHR